MDYRQTYFFQSELPYTVNHTYGDNGFAGFRVNESVKNHDGYGIGVYVFNSPAFFTT